MKRKFVTKLLCAVIVSVMFITNTAVLYAYEEERKTVVYDGKQMTVTVTDDSVIFEDGTSIPLDEFDGEFIETEPEKPEETESKEEDNEAPAELPDNVPEAAEELQPEIGDESGAEEVLPETEEEEKEEVPSEVREESNKNTVSEKKSAESAEEVKAEEKKEQKAVYIAPTVTAGTEFYVKELEEKYCLTFKDEFEDVVSEIETEFIEEIMRQHSGESSLKEKTDGKVEDEAEDDDAEVRFTNWQDVLAVYLLSEKKADAETFVMDTSDKSGIADVFIQMNTGEVIDGKIEVTAVYIEDYVEEHKDNLDESECSFLEKYTSANCGLLCAAATGIKGFIVESLGVDISEERTETVVSAYSLVGKVSYFWGGKSSVIGWDSRWGDYAEVTAAGSRSTGAVQSYGLDCSGFVTWAFINGYEEQEAVSLIGHGTTSQWGKSIAITEEEALPGDLVFLQPPDSQGINHVGIVVGRNDDGKLAAVHCNASDNGVVVESAYQAGFRYVRRPVCFEE